MPKTCSSKPITAKVNDAQGQRFDPLFVRSRLKRWKQAARELHKTSCANYKEIKAYLLSVEMTNEQKRSIATALSKFIYYYA